MAHPLSRGTFHLSLTEVCVGCAASMTGGCGAPGAVFATIFSDDALYAPFLPDSMDDFSFARGRGLA